MDITLHNAFITIKVREKGAELFSIVHRQTGLEYMWSGDPAYWAKTSPILFPIVGTLRNDTYYYKGKPYTLPRHGFARDSVFTIESQTDDRVTWLLTSTTASLEHYPFAFELRVVYALEGATLHTTYSVVNTSGDEMFFSLGAHPAFRVPLADGTVYEDYFLAFSSKETAPRWPISKDGLIEALPEPLLENSDRLPLTKDLFRRDAVVLKHLASERVSINTTNHAHGLDFFMQGFPYLGLWAAKGADFLCIEPWCGIADAVTHDQQLVKKEGIESLPAGGSWSRTWKAKFY